MSFLPHPSPTVVARGWDYRVGQVLSYVLNPFILPPVTYALLLTHFRAPGPERFAIAVIAAVCFSLVPLAFVLFEVRTGRIASVEVRHRPNRIRPLLVGLLSSLAGLGLMAQTGTTLRGFVVASAVCYVVNIVLALLVTLHWKISLHLIGLAGCAATLLFAARTPWPVDPPAAYLEMSGLLPLFALVPLLMWARVRTGAHTWAQVWGGALFGFVLPYLELYLITYGVLGLA